MQLLCWTLSAMALFLCGAFVALCAGRPRGGENRRERTGETAVPPVPPAHSTFEDDLSALLRYTPNDGKEEADEI